MCAFPRCEKQLCRYQPSEKMFDFFYSKPPQPPTPPPTQSVHCVHVPLILLLTAEPGGTATSM